MTKLHHGQYVQMDVLPNGNLRVTLTEEGITEAKDRHDEHVDDDIIFFDLFNEDDHIGAPYNNGGPYFTPDISCVDGGHLSQAPAIVSDWRPNDKEEPDYVDEGYVAYLTNDDSRVWYWGDYMITSILEHIKRQGEAILTLLT